MLTEKMRYLTQASSLFTLIPLEQAMSSPEPEQWTTAMDVILLDEITNLPGFPHMSDKWCQHVGTSLGKSEQQIRKRVEFLRRTQPFGSCGLSHLSNAPLGSNANSSTAAPTVVLPPMHLHSDPPQDHNQTQSSVDYLTRTVNNNIITSYVVERGLPLTRLAPIADNNAARRHPMAQMTSASTSNRFSDGINQIQRFQLENVHYRRPNQGISTGRTITGSVSQWNSVGTYSPSNAAPTHVTFNNIYCSTTSNNSLAYSNQSYASTLSVPFPAATAENRSVVPHETTEPSYETDVTNGLNVLKRSSSDEGDSLLSKTLSFDESVTSIKRSSSTGEEVQDGDALDSRDSALKTFVSDTESILRIRAMSPGGNVTHRFSQGGDTLLTGASPDHDTTPPFKNYKETSEVFAAECETDEFGAPTTIAAKTASNSRDASCTVDTETSTIVTSSAVDQENIALKKRKVQKTSLKELLDAVYAKAKSKQSHVAGMQTALVDIQEKHKELSQANKRSEQKLAQIQKESSVKIAQFQKESQIALVQAHQEINERVAEVVKTSEDLNDRIESLERLTKELSEKIETAEASQEKFVAEVKEFLIKISDHETS